MCVCVCALLCRALQMEFFNDLSKNFSELRSPSRLLVGFPYIFERISKIDTRYGRCYSFNYSAIKKKMKFLKEKKILKKKF